MLEIFILIKLCRNIGDILRAKGRSAGGYQFLTVVLWFLFEFIGAAIGVAMGLDVAAYLLALGGAFAGYGIAKAIAESAKPSKEYAAEMASRASSWTCPLCHTQNTMFDKTCSKVGCYEKRPTAQAE